MDLLERAGDRGNGWVSRKEIVALWAGKTSGRDEADAVNKGINSLRNALEKLRPWIAPHLRIEIIQDHRHRPTKYHLQVTQFEPSWFLNPQFMETLPWIFSYAFLGHKARKVEIQLWTVAKANRVLDVHIQRVSRDATWAPPDHVKEYEKARTAFFSALAEQADREHLHPMHDGNIWGIQDVKLVGTDDHRILSIQVMRTKYSDRPFLRARLDTSVPFLAKEYTYRQWLSIGSEPLDEFVPAVHCLCMSVMVVSYGDPDRKRDMYVYLSKQKPGGDSTVAKWDVTAAGVMSSSRISMPEREPMLRTQVRELLSREVGLPAEDNEISWLGFARAPQQRNSSLFALVEIKLAPAKILACFQNRHSRDDVVDLAQVKMGSVEKWLDNLPAENRREFLETGIAMTAIRYGLAELRPGLSATS